VSKRKYSHNNWHIKKGQANLSPWVDNKISLVYLILIDQLELIIDLLFKILTQKVYNILKNKTPENIDIWSILSAK